MKLVWVMHYKRNFDECHHNKTSQSNPTEMKNKGKNIVIRKASGETEYFDAEKLLRSLQQAGADRILAESILGEVERDLFDGMKTKLIYTMAFRMLRRKNRRHAMHYRLKRSLFDFGQTGFPFEHFIGEIFKKRGYRVEVGKIIQGHCISHEVDVIAVNAAEQIFIECKYGVDQGKYVSVQVPLYVRSRMDDIIRLRKELPENAGVKFTGGIATNTRFSDDSVDFGKCSGLMLLGWDYPAGYGLKEIIERDQVYPITLLEHLSSKQKSVLVEKGIVTCSQLFEQLNVIEEFRLSPVKAQNLVDELRDILNK